MHLVFFCFFFMAILTAQFAFPQLIFFTYGCVDGQINLSFSVFFFSSHVSQSWRHCPNCCFRYHRQSLIVLNSDPIVMEPLFSSGAKLFSFFFQPFQEVHNFSICRKKSRVPFCFIRCKIFFWFWLKVILRQKQTWCIFTSQNVFLNAV